MSYITGYLRGKRNRRVDALVEKGHEPVFQIDFETWYASLAGWNPVPSHKAGALTRIKANEDKISKAA
jgi:hypothetical protein